MKNDYIKDETTIELVLVDKKKYICRGSLYCKYWHAGIPKGQRVLRIKTEGAGGSSVSFYCNKCMKPLIEKMKKVLEEIEKE